MKSIVINCPCSCQVVAKLYNRARYRDHETGKGGPKSSVIEATNIEQICLKHTKEWQKFVMDRTPPQFTENSIAAKNDFIEWVQKFVILDDAERLMIELKK